jgi:hypothetical protein
MLDVGCWMLDVGRSMLDVGCSDALDKNPEPEFPSSAEVSSA